MTEKPHGMLVLDDVKAPSSIASDGTPVPQEGTDSFPCPVVPVQGTVMLEPIQVPAGRAPRMIQVASYAPAIGMDEATHKVFEKYGMPRLGGASGRGWSSRSALQRCPYLYKTLYITKPDFILGRSAFALETGSCFHTFIAIGYENMIKGPEQPGETRLRPSVLKAELIAMGADAAAIMEAWRLFTAYVDRYQVDYIKPIAVELFASDEEGNTCRYDLIAEVNHPDGILIPGTYIVEHKTAARFDDATLDGWFNDGEILGQINIWKKAKLHKKYGELQGVIVNLVSKTKEPAFERTIVPTQPWQTKQHESDLRMLEMEEALYKATGIWPRRRAGCVNKFGKCQLFDHCANRLAPT